MRRALTITLLAALATVTLGSTLSQAGVRGRFGGQVIYLRPNAADTETLGDANWGGGISAVIVPPGVLDALAFGVGLEFIWFGGQTIELRDPDTLLRVEQQTSQTMVRIPIGARIGHQGHGFLRPYAGANFSLNFFSVDTDVVVPDDRTREDAIRQNLSGDTEFAPGFDLMLGTELNFNNRVYWDMGVKFIRTFNAPQQLVDSLEEINANYIEVFVGMGVTFSMLNEM